MQAPEGSIAEPNKELHRGHQGHPEGQEHPGEREEATGEGSEGECGQELHR